MDRVRNEKVLREAGIEREFSKWSKSESIEMVWACGKNIRVRYGQKGADSQNQCRACMRETEVRLDGWCEGGLRQWRNDGGGCSKNRKSGEPWYLRN